MKKLIALLLIAAMSVLPVQAEETNVFEEKTTWDFTDEPVDEDDLRTILQAGLNTDSAMNEQPWMFHVITDADLIAELSGRTKTPVVVVISVSDGNQMKLFDAGLAAQNIQIAARSLGYGSKIETSPTRMIRNDQSGTWDQRLGIPEGKTAAATVYIGHKASDTDAISSASTRFAFEDMVKYVE